MLEKIYITDSNPGSISNIYEIKILICHILNRTKTPITREQLNAALQLNKIVNYFNFCQAVIELKNGNQILEEQKKDQKIYLLLTPTGKEMIKTIDNNPNIAIKKTLNSIENIIKQEQQNKNKKVYIKTKKDGFTVKLILEEPESNLIDLELFCPTQDTAEKFKKQMELKTTKIYQAILAVINDEENTLSNIAKSLKTKI